MNVRKLLYQARYSGRGLIEVSKPAVVFSFELYSLLNCSIIIVVNVEPDVVRQRQQVLTNVLQLGQDSSHPISYSS